MTIKGPPRPRPKCKPRPGSVPAPVAVEKKVLEKQVAQYLYRKMKSKAIGGECYGWSSINMRGVTDKICVFPPSAYFATGRICFVELKKDIKGKLSPNQAKFHARMAEMKVQDCYVLHGKEEVDLWLKSMGY